MILKIYAGYMYVIPEKIRYDNKNLPLGQSSVEFVGGHDISVTLERVW